MIENTNDDDNNNNNRMVEMSVETVAIEKEERRGRVLICEGFNKIHHVENFCNLPLLEGSNYTPQKQNTIWYSNQDMCTFQEQAKNDIAEGNNDIRGLECIVDLQTALAKKRFRVRTIQSVLIAQQLAHEHHAKEPASKRKSLDKFLCRVSCKESRQARRMALVMGRADEDAAQHSILVPSIII